MFTSAISTTWRGERATRYEDSLAYHYYYGGSVAWRNNNPGNLRYNDFATAQKHGAIGTGKDNFAIFPTYATGYNALEYCITVEYKNKSVEDTMYKFAPPNENDTEAYIKYLEKTLGVSRKTKVSELSSAQQTKFCEAIKKYEGYKAGKIERVKKGIELAV